MQVNNTGHRKSSAVTEMQVEFRAWGRIKKGYTEEVALGMHPRVEEV